MDLRFSPSTLSLSRDHAEKSSGDKPGPLGGNRMRWPLATVPNVATEPQQRINQNAGWSVVLLLHPVGAQLEPALRRYLQHSQIVK